jgi:hypothetical protein
MTRLPDFHMIEIIQFIITSLSNNDDILDKTDTNTTYVRRLFTLDRSIHLFRHGNDKFQLLMLKMIQNVSYYRCSSYMMISFVFIVFVLV